MLAKLRKYLSSSAEPQPIGGEGPRGFVGGLWYEMGELQFKFLVEHGLRPEHALLDVACGSLRLGTRVVPYLATGNYLGIDIDQSLIEHGKTVELGTTLCDIKRPEFVVSGSFEFEKLSKRPDFAVAQSLFSHLIEPDITLCLAKLSRYRKDNTVFYATFFEVDAPVTNPPQSHPHGIYRFTRGEMEAIGKRNGWKMDYIGDWNHPRKQMMVRYAPA
jgi:ubiquinone/menaquinone biosynthesis C-methylase UbiE